MNKYYIKKSREEYDENFKIIINKYPEPKYLTTKGFNSVSEISIMSYTVSFKINWYDLLKEYKQFDKLYEYAKQEFINYMERTNNINVVKFIKEHLYLSQDFAKYVGFKKFKQDCGVLRNRYTKAMLKENILKIKNDLGRIPNHSEFIKLSKIDTKTYKESFNLKGQIWDDIIQLYFSKEEISEFEDYQREHFSIIYANNRRIYDVTDIELKENFINLFTYYKNNYNVYPNRKIFNKISEFSWAVYKRRLNVETWGEVCNFYGYNINENSKYTSEIFVLNLISNILKVEYKPQKTFDWLRNKDGNKLRVDGFYKDYNLIIEFDGDQHKKPRKIFGGIEQFKKQQANDKIKNELIPQHGIKLIRIDINSPWHDIDYLKNLLIENNIPLHT